MSTAPQSIKIIIRTKKNKAVVPVFKLELSPSGRTQCDSSMNSPTFDPTTPLCNFPSFPDFPDFQATPFLGGLLRLGTNEDAEHAPPDVSLLSMAKQCKPNKDEDMWVPLDDHSDEDISRWIPSATEFIKRNIERQKTVLVYCQRGVSRSATIVIAYFMRYHQDILHKIQIDESNTTMTHSLYQKAFAYVKARRIIISPNLGFCTSLIHMASTMQNATKKILVQDDDVKFA
jgi:Dual specificity phosphatase, catalytic domain